MAVSCLYFCDDKISIAWSKLEMVSVLFLSSVYFLTGLGTYILSSKHMNILACFFSRSIPLLILAALEISNIYYYLKKVKPNYLFHMVHLSESLDFF